MENGQFWSIISMMGAGFGWLIYQMKDLDKKISGVEARVAVVETRIAVIETILSMMGMPIREKK